MMRNHISSIYFALLAACALGQVSAAPQIRSTQNSNSSSTTTTTTSTTTTTTTTKTSTPQTSSPGYTLEPAPVVYAKGTDSCLNYNTEPIDWQAAKNDILVYLSQPETELIGPDQVPYKRVAAMLVRAAFHDAGAFQSGVGGADGSLILNNNEQHVAANGSPLQFVPYVRAALNPIAQKYHMSYADAIAFGGAVAAQFLGQASGMYSLKVGRCDSNLQNPEVLPADNLTYRQFVDYWQSVGIQIEDAAALMGSHTIVEDGTNHSNGVQQYEWGNTFFKDSVTGNISVINDTTVQWSTGKTWQYTINDAHDAPQNVANNCPFAKMYKNLVQDFAINPATWEQRYVSAYGHLTDIGATWSNTASVITV